MAFTQPKAFFLFAVFFFLNIPRVSWAFFYRVVSEGEILLCSCELRIGRQMGLGELGL